QRPPQTSSRSLQLRLPPHSRECRRPDPHSDAPSHRARPLRSRASWLVLLPAVASYARFGSATQVMLLQKLPAKQSLIQRTTQVAFAIQHYLCSTTSTLCAAGDWNCRMMPAGLLEEWNPEWTTPSFQPSSPVSLFRIATFGFSRSVLCGTSAATR